MHAREIVTGAMPNSYGPNPELGCSSSCPPAHVCPSAPLMPATPAILATAPISIAHCTASAHHPELGLGYRYSVGAQLGELAASLIVCDETSRTWLCTGFCCLFPLLPQSVLGIKCNLNELQVPSYAMPRSVLCASGSAVV